MWLTNKYVIRLVIIALLLVFVGPFLYNTTRILYVKDFGGSMTVDLPPNRKLVNVSWKDGDLWYATRPMLEDEEAQTSVFQEQSLYGIFQGTVTIIEHRE